MYAEVVALIPARAGSKGLPGKNTKNLCGKPLFMHSVLAALNAGISRVFISTDVPDILNYDLPDGVQAVKRAAHLAADQTPMADVVTDFLENTFIGSATVVLLQPTSPLRTSLHVKEALDVFRTENCSLAMSVCLANSGILKWGLVSGRSFQPISKPEHCFANRQSLPSVYRPNGAVYVFDAQAFRVNRDFSSTSIQVIQMTETESLDIDTLADFSECEKLIAQGAAQ